MPYCHGWEVRDRRFGYLAAPADALSFASLLSHWTDDVMVRDIRARIYAGGDLTTDVQAAVVAAAAGMQAAARLNLGLAVHQR
jgi:hypothetical protein